VADSGAASDPVLKRIKLHYAGSCRSCVTQLPAGTLAVYDRAGKNVCCLSCFDSGVAAVEPTDLPVASPPEPEHSGPLPTEAPTSILTGAAGASARREQQRRKDKREAGIRQAHPHLGGLILALSDDPQGTQAWAVGARGEELLARCLDKLADEGVRLLHDRRISRTTANIDHIAIAPSGVFVIDAKRYTGRPHLRVEGGLLRARTEKLIVGTRDCTRLVEGARKQMDLVGAALARSGAGEVPVHGMLCFVEADWPLFGGAFTIFGVDVLWPKKAAEILTRGGPLDRGQIDELVRRLAVSFPSA
jgi:Nuclease-related domain